MALPFEDPVTLAVNAAKPLVDRLSEAERQSIGMVAVATELGLDLGKSLATYVHHHLGLPRGCRLFEVKQACYGGTAALQMALGVTRTAAAGMPTRALVICTDTARPIPHSYAEPTQGAAAVALLVGPEPRLIEIAGPSGIHGYEVMDACRPTPDLETGDADLSLLSYLDCIEKSFAAYRQRAGDVDYAEDFDFLAFHTPFGGMVRGAHRSMMRRLKALPPPAIEADFQRRLAPSLRYCREVGNIYSGTIFLALCGVLAGAGLGSRRRSGFSPMARAAARSSTRGTAGPEARDAVAEVGLDAMLADRRELSIEEYDHVLEAQATIRWGQRNQKVGDVGLGALYAEQFAGQGLLVLDGVGQLSPPVSLELMVPHRTLEIGRERKLLRVVLSRPERRNALSAGMIAELHAALDEAEGDPDLRLVVLAAKGPVFCDGMDFAEAASGGTAAAGAPDVIGEFYRLMTRLTRSSKVVVSLVEGRVNAGGMGLVAASDYVIARSAASFGLSEVLFGLLPATVAPFLIRRIGFQPAFRLGLTAQRIDAEAARAINLVDELSADPDDALRRLLIRMERVREPTVAALKAHFADLWIMSAETERRSIARIKEAIADPQVAADIRAFVNDQVLPWQTPSA